MPFPTDKPMNTPTDKPTAKKARRKSLQSGQAAVLMAVVIALLFAIFTLVFEVGRLLVAREVAISASQRAGEAALSYLVDYAEQRGDWNQLVLNAQRNTQVWTTFYDENTGIPQWLRGQALRYLVLNLSDHTNLITPSSIAALTVQSVEFPYKESNWPTATIGIRMHVTVTVPLVFFGGLTQPNLPIGVETTAITSVDELLGVQNDTVAPAFGQGGSVTEFTGQPRRILNSVSNWVEPFDHFDDLGASIINQWWGCPNSFTSAYNYAKGRHAGMDFGIPEGNRLYAVANSTVYFVGPYPNQLKPTGDNSVILKTDDGAYYVTYMHMLNFNVTQGQHVSAGDLLGISDGDPTKHPASFTGFSTGAHLHFQVAQGKFYDYPYDRDPESFLGLGTDNQHSKAPLGANGECFPVVPTTPPK